MLNDDNVMKRRDNGAFSFLPLVLCWWKYIWDVYYAYLDMNHPSNK